jgi:hypothetical protein
MQKRKSFLKEHTPFKNILYKKMGVVWLYTNISLLYYIIIEKFLY